MNSAPLVGLYEKLKARCSILLFFVTGAVPMGKVRELCFTSSENQPRADFVPMDRGKNQQLIRIQEAAADMVIYKACRLHKGINNRRPDEAEAAFLKFCRNAP